MRTGRFCGLVLIFTCMVWVSGCGGQLRDLRIKNEAQQRRIENLQSELNAARLELDQLKRKLATYGQQGNVEIEALQSQIAALEEALAQKKSMIESLQEKLLKI